MSINRNNLYQQVAQSLGKKIVRRELVPGDVLPSINDMGDNYQVSQTVMREALKLLAAKGMVSPKQRIGVIVTPRTEWSMFDPELLLWRVEFALNKAFLNDLLGLREAIEPGAASLAVKNATEEDIAELRACFHQLEDNVTNSEAFIDADLEFHAKIVAITHNEMMLHLTKVLQIAILAITKCTTRVPGAFKESLATHGALVDAIAARDRERAIASTFILLEEASAQVNKFLQSKPEERIATFERAAQEITEYITISQ